MKRPSPTFDPVRTPVSPHGEEGLSDGKAQAIAAAGPAHPELRGGLDRDLGRLQGLMDGAVEQMRDAFARVVAVLDAGPVAEETRERIAKEAGRILTCLQFHDIASQMIANMRSRSALLELAALVAVPANAAQEHARLLDQAARLAARCPDDSSNDQGGDVELFQRDAG